MQIKPLDKPPKSSKNCRKGCARNQMRCTPNSLPLSSPSSFPSSSSFTMAASTSQNDQLLQIYPTSPARVSPFWREKYEKNARKYWDVFYKGYENKFFKDRSYLDKEWGLYFTCPQDNDESKLYTGRNSDMRKVVSEVGCGAGNTVFPLISTFPNIFVHACDFSQRAIDLVKAIYPISGAGFKPYSAM
ncbi:methyltransferase-like protein 6 isoform X2 [Amborella trichopoda]|uniref:methyltransferase-like protein 6 isoform X2 n=1 Tax=Amborella trichopoda TaxID=13333 RepID=UPI0009C02878|nr:methyltransferase-like protein 6 isoform X2 [Amborella trichopoda]XP_020529561.1 methyltransferase-like protein 6 isoform X2 [Amborella trichopoda]|eukprot:XP_020529560.1 methyltransferase-like protein 6 isoform X2 [Amborella trichopoda]